jgi:hypothetical protein
MTGIMTAIGGSGQPVLYTAGLYRAGAGPDQSPISASVFNNLTPLEYTWTGYILAPTTGSLQFGISANTNNFGSYGDYSIGYMWLGYTAKSGYTTGNAFISANNNYVTNTYAMTQGVYYPVRLLWQTYAPGGYQDPTTTNFTLYYAGGNNVSGLIFYNSVTNSF